MATVVIAVYDDGEYVQSYDLDSNEARQKLRLAFQYDWALGDGEYLPSEGFWYWQDGQFKPVNVDVSRGEFNDLDYASGTAKFRIGDELLAEVHFTVDGRA